MTCCLGPQPATSHGVGGFIEDGLGAGPGGGREGLLLFRGRRDGDTGLGASAGGGPDGALCMRVRLG